ELPRHARQVFADRRLPPERLVDGRDEVPLDPLPSRDVVLRAGHDRVLLPLLEIPARVLIEHLARGHVAALGRVDRVLHAQALVFELTAGAIAQTGGWIVGPDRAHLFAPGRGGLVGEARARALCRPGDLGVDVLDRLG